MFYLESFIASLLLSTIFGIGGVGSSIALIPLLNFIGVSFNLAKAIGLLVNTVTTSTATFLNIRNNYLKFNFIMPFALLSVIFAPFGAYLSHIVNIETVKLIFVTFIFYSSYSMVFKKKRVSRDGKNMTWVMYPLGVIIGLLSGLLGIGGGAMIIPTLSWLGIEMRLIPVYASVMISFTTFSAFLSYAFIINLDWILVMVTTVAAIAGGYLGNVIMHKLSPKRMNLFLAIQLCLIGIKMLWDIIVK